jgi:hypothetical protein
VEQTKASALMIPAVPLKMGWYANLDNNLCYVHSLPYDVDTDVQMAVFILQSGPKARLTQVQRLDNFIMFLKRGHYQYSGKLPPDGRIAILPI